MYNIYIRRGFTVYLFLMYQNFEFLHDNMLGISELNTNAVKECMEDIERKILITREWSRAICIIFPLKKVPCRITIKLIMLVVFWVNAFPQKPGNCRRTSVRLLWLANTCITQAPQIQVWLLCQGPHVTDPVKNYGRKYTWINILQHRQKNSGVL